MRWKLSDSRNAHAKSSIAKARKAPVWVAPLALATATFVAIPDAVHAATLTLVNSSARAQVAASNRPRPNDIRDIDPLLAEVIEPALGGSSSADALNGLMRFATTADDTTGSGSFGTTNSTSLSYLFRYNGASPLTLSSGALTYSVDADLARSFAVPLVDGQPVAAQTNFRSGLVMDFGPPGQATGGVEVTEVSDGRLTVNPNASQSNVGLSISRQDQSGFDAVFAAPSLTLNDGNIFGFTVSMVGNGVRVGPQGAAVLGAMASIDASNTGILSLLLPQGVTIAGLEPGQNLSWVNVAKDPTVIPLPPGAVLLFSGFALGLSLLRKRRRAA